jgi:TP901 family phage tail tape measure protein
MRPFTVKTEIVAADKASKNINKINRAAERMSKTVTKESNISGSAFSRFSSKIGIATKRASASLGVFNSRVSQISRNVRKKVGGMLGTLGKLGVGLALSTVLIGIVKANVEVDDSMASLSAITGKTGEEFKTFSEQVGKVAKEQTLFAGDTAKAFEVVASAQPVLLDNAEALGRVTNAAITLSKASGDDLASSALSLTGVMNQFNLEADQSERVMNALAAGSVAGSANITNVAASMKNFGAVASSANLSVEQSISLIEVMGSKSIFAEDAGNKLKASILNLQAAGLGYESGLFNMSDALETLKKKVDAAKTAKQKDAIVTSVFKKTGIATGQILLNNIGMYKDMTEAVTGTTTAVTQMNTKANTFSNRWMEIQASFKNSVTAIQSNTDQMQWLKNAMAKVSENMDKIISVVVTAIKVFVAFKAVMIGLRIAQNVLRAATFAYNVVLGIQSALIGSASIAMKGNAVAIWVMNAATKAMSIATLIYTTGLSGAIAATWAFTSALLGNPITWIVIGIAALIVGIVLLVKHFDKVKTAIKAAWDVIENNKLLQLLILPVYLTIKAIQYLKNNFEAIKQSFINFGVAVANNKIFQLLVLPITLTIKAIKFLIQNFDVIKSTVMNVVNSVIGLFSNMWNFIKAIARYISVSFNIAFDSIVSKLSGAISFVRNIFSSIGDMGKTLITPFEPIYDFIMNLGKIIGTMVIDKFKQIGDFVAKIIDKISAFFGNSAETINAKTEQLITVNSDKQNKEVSKEVSKTLETQDVTETTKNKTIENEAIKTKSADKLANALDKNTKSSENNTEVQKAKKDEWKGKFVTTILKDANINNRTNSTNNLAESKIKNEENIINTQKNTLNEISKNNIKKTDTNTFSNSELNRVNEINKYVNSELAISSIKNEENVINTQKDVLRESNISENTSNVLNKEFVSESNLVKQKDISTINNQGNTSNTNNRKSDKKQEITINVVDKTGGKFGVQVEGTGITVKPTGNV